MGSTPKWGPRGTKLECVYFFSYVESSRRSRVSTNLVLPQGNTRSPHISLTPTCVSMQATPGVWGPTGTRTPQNSPVVARSCDANLRSWQLVCLFHGTHGRGWHPSRFIRFVTPMRHLYPCGLAPLDALLGGGFPCCALSQVFLVSLSGLPMHIDYESLCCSSRRPAIALT
jgi:hypothetical protein